MTGGQRGGEAMDRMARLREVMGRIWASRRIAEDHAALCACGGRFAGTDSEAAAREFLAGRLAEAAGADVVRERVAYHGWTRGPAEVVLPDGRRLPALGLVRTVATPAGGLTAPLVDVGRGTPEQIAQAGEAVHDAIVLVRHEYMLGVDHVHRRRKYDAARAAGAAGFVISFHEPGGLAVTGSSGDGGAGHIPAVGIGFESGAALAECAGGAVTLHASGSFADAWAENLFATLPGSGAFVVLSAHYDGHDPACSAIDNASGVAVAIAVAEAVRDFVADLDRRLQVALFTVEEWALIGSAVHLETMDAGVRDGIAFNVNLDSVAGDGALAAITGGFPGVAGFVRRALAPAGLSVGLHEGFMANSDHANFVRWGIPALRLCAGMERPRSNLRFLLTAADTPDKVNPHELKTAACVAAGLVLGALSGDLPARVGAEEGRRIAEAVR
ncbi:MAG TPA: M28 family peptidase [Acidisphaera sp.]|nr:M28 family peptidase [Acidisphaera sp.]